MLKERIDYLCKKKGISRKELVEGFVTTAHFANILAERYPLPEDLAGHLAQRLQVPPSYLVEAGNTDQDTLETANRIFEELSQAAQTLETLVSKLQIPRAGDTIGLAQHPANPSELVYMGLIS